MLGLRFFGKIFSKYKVLLENIGFLSILKLVEMLIPLVTVPYLTRTIGLSNYGRVAFALSLGELCALIVRFGFDVTSVQKISSNKKDWPYIKRIFWSTFLIKSGIMILCLGILSMVILSIPELFVERRLYFSSFLVVVFEAISCVWFYQGIQKMKYITYFNLSGRFASLLFIFTLVESPEDYDLVPLFQFIGPVVLAIFSIYFAINKFKLNFFIPDRLLIISAIKDSSLLFLQRISLNLYTSFNIPILGILTDPSTTGIYAAGFKIIKTVNSLRVPLSQALFPHVSELMSKSRESGIIFLKKIIKIIGFVYLLISAVTFVLSDWITLTLLGEEFAEAAAVLRILSLFPFFVSLSSIIALQGMINLGYKSQSLAIVTIVGIIHMSLMLLFGSSGYMFLSWLVLFSECLVVILMSTFLRVKGIRLIL